ncbi:hypothetical protein DFH29DRAFT_870108 [Suillus ampliporus]|nr:hypothetical protein DFH29DRAFT_870108 [Suillus ampliporus]
MPLLLCMILHFVGVIQTAPTTTNTTTTLIVALVVVPFTPIFRVLRTASLVSYGGDLASRRTRSRIPHMFRYSSPAPQDHDSTLLLVAHAEVIHGTPVSTSEYGGTRAFAKPFNKLVKAYVSEQTEGQPNSFSLKPYPTFDSWASLYYAWTQTHSFFVLMGGFTLYVDGKPTIHYTNRIHGNSKGNVIPKGLVIL